MAFINPLAILRNRRPLFLFLVGFFYLSPFYIFFSNKEHILPLLIALFAAASFGYLIIATTKNPAILTWNNTEVYVGGLPYYLPVGTYYMPTVPTLILLTRARFCLGMWANQEFGNQRSDSVQVRIDNDRSNFDFKANVQMTAGQALAAKTIGSSTDFLTTRKALDGPREVYFQSFSLSCVVIVWVVAFISPNKGDVWFWEGGKKSGAPTSRMTQAGTSTKNTVSVSVQLEKRDQPVYPEEEFFAPVEDDHPEYVMVSKNGKKRKYFFYKEAADGLPKMRVTESSCFAVPVGRKKKFFGKYPPTFAINMKWEIVYVKRAENLSLPTKVVRRIANGEPLDSPFYPMEKSWEQAYDEWSTVVPEFGFVAEAQTLDELSQGNHGGLVCF